MKDGGPAFPMITPDGVDWNVGMSLRDYFAAAATDKDIEDAGVRFAQRNTNGTFRQLDRIEARWAHADAMLASREKEQS